jgi:hypothetical protein
LATGSALTFDGTNFGVGISNPAQKLEVVGTQGRIRLDPTNVSGVCVINFTDVGAGSFGVGALSASELRFNTNGTEAMRLTSSSLYTASGINVGFGTSSPVEKLTVNGAIAVTGGITGHGANRTTLSQEGSNGAFWQSYGANTSTYGTFKLRQASSDFSLSRTAVEIDTSGNLGLGVTPSAWRSGDKAIQVGSVASLNTDTNVTTDVGYNYFYNSSNVAIYSTTAQASRYSQYLGAHRFFTAASGTAGNAITFTQAMTLSAAGNLVIGDTTGNGKLSVRDSSAALQEIYTTAGTGYAALEVKNGSGGVYFGKDNSAGSFFGSNTGYASCLYSYGAFPLVFFTNGTERARIDSSGNFNATSSNATGSHKLSKGSATARFQLQVGESYPVNFYEGNGYGFNAAATLIEVSVNSVTSRSINAGGTINASGADYAEYMKKSGDFTVAKGDVVGIDAQGKLTNVFADAVSFVVKSTDPSYVGGDTWGSVDVLGIRPNEEATQAEKDAYESSLEAARQTVDRIAFAGQVPVNVTGATAGQYIIAINDNGSIKGQAISNPTFEQYQSSVGKVIAIETDGRARIIVKVA